MKELLEPKTLLALAVIIIGIPLLYYIITKGNKERKKQATILWQQYQDALKGGNKAQALQAGRRYYSQVRGGRLTIYDEQALNNDLAAMK